MSKLWDESGATIVLLPSGDQGKALYQVAKSWSELGLISVGLWITPDLALPETGLVPKQTVVALGKNKNGLPLEVQVELFEQLAMGPIQTIRLVVVKTSVPDAEQDAKQENLINSLTQYLQHASPKTQMRDDGKKVAGNLLLLNLIVAPTEHASSLGKSLFNPKFNANFVAAVEDRSGPNSTDGFVRSEENQKFAGFAMMHVATLGALWVGLPSGTFELIQSGVSSTSDAAYVSRVYVSAILTDGLARRASSRVLQRAADPYSGVLDLTRNAPIDGTYEIDSSQIDAVIDQLVKNTFEFDNKMLSYESFIAKSLDHQYWAHWYQQIFDFLKFSGDKLLRVPYFAVLWIASRFVRMLNAIFQGGDKGSTLIREPEERFDALDRSIKNVYQDVLKTKEQADEALVAPVSPSWVKSSPELWERLRKMLFGILDGSNTESFGFPVKENRVPMFHRVSSLFTDPAEKLTIADPENPSEQIELGWTDLIAGQDLSNRFSDLQKASDEKIKQALANVVQLEKDLESSTKRIAAIEERLKQLTQSGEAAEVIEKTEVSAIPAIPLEQEEQANV